MSYDPMEVPVLTIQWRPRRAGKRAETEEELRRVVHDRLDGLETAMNGVRDRTGADLHAFYEDLAVFGVAMVGANGERIEPYRAVLR
jgi:hypothetical protein